MDLQQLLPAQKPPQLLVDQQRGSTAACRLLVVDDDGMVRVLIHMVLLDKKAVRAGWAFDIRTAGDVTEAYTGGRTHFRRGADGREHA